MKICAATDLSDSGTAAIQHTFDWAKKHGASVLLLHVVHDPELAPAFSDDVPGAVAHARDVLTKIADQAAVPCEVDVRRAEHVADEIAAASKDCDYLFVGSQGKSAFERLRVGSVATRLLRQSHTPIVCVPPPQATNS